MATSAALSIADLLAEAATRLRTAGIEQPRLEARWLLGHILGLSASELILQDGRVPSADLVQRYRAAVERRARHEPFAYVVGQREFYGRSFVVDRRVLVPRPETELLIEEALRVLSPWREAPPPVPLPIAMERGSRPATACGDEMGDVGFGGEVQAASARGGPDDRSRG
jgi:release factor glutamine methyltransferase